MAMGKSLWFWIVNAVPAGRGSTVPVSMFCKWSPALGKPEPDITSKSAGDLNVYVSDFNVQLETWHEFCH